VNHRVVIGSGVIGAAITLICCTTSLLWVALGAVGLSAWLAWADWALGIRFGILRRADGVRLLFAP
jgi:mercuric ion transport protein